MCDGILSNILKTLDVAPIAAYHAHILIQDQKKLLSNGRF